MPLQFESKLDDSQFQRALKSMEANSAKAAGAISSGFDKAGSALGKGFIAGAAAISVKEFGSSILQMAGELSDASAALDINAERLQGLQASFATAGVSAETFRSGLTKAAESLEEIRTKDGPAREALEKLGLSFEDVANSDLDEFLLQITEGFSNASDKGRALTAVVDLLGKAGKQMAAGMADGRESVDGFAKSASVLSDKNLKVLDDLGDSAQEMGRKFRVFIGNHAVEAVKGLRDSMAEVIGLAQGGKFNFTKTGLLADVATPNPANNPLFKAGDGNSSAPKRVDPKRAGMQKRAEEEEAEFRKQTAEADKQFDDEKKQRAQKMDKWIQEQEELEFRREEEYNRQKEKLRGQLADALQRKDDEAMNNRVRALEEEQREAEAIAEKRKSDQEQFNNSDANTRRQMVRDERAEERALNHNRTGKDARFGSSLFRTRREEAAQAAADAKAKADKLKAAIDDASIEKLKKAIGELVLAP